jgi:phosphoribosyl-ATP pyrophosphohydrolase
MIRTAGEILSARGSKFDLSGVVLAVTEHQQPSADVLDRLMSEIHTRVRDLPVGSYTTKLVQGGVAAMGAKVLEEAAEVVAAAEQTTSPDNHHLIYEACDVIYHLWVLLGSRGISVDDLRNELARREGTSGLEEKRQRK